MQAEATVLCSIASGAANSVPITWKGGKTALVISATTFPSTCNLQVQNQDGAWININATTISANSCVAYDLPAGSYRMNLAGGTVAAVTAVLSLVPY